MQLPIWMLQLALNRLLAVTITGTVSGEFRVINGDTLPHIYLHDEGESISLTMNGLTVTMPIEGMLMGEERPTKHIRGLTLVSNVGITVQLDFRL